MQLQLISQLFLFGACLAKLPAFLPCARYDNKQSRSRSCYKSSLLPLGCECFDVSKDSDFTNSKYTFLKIFTSYFLPSSPKDLNDIRFLLYTSSNEDEHQIIASNDASIQKSNFDANKPTIFITHGFNDKAPVSWSTSMKKQLLKQGGVNVILVNWENGAGGIDYFKVVANVRLVGAIMGQLIHVMKHTHRVNVKNIHLIGHSLGAHVSGTAAKEFRRLNNGELIGRVTGLDPAGLRFGSYGVNVRLDKTDAQFVDVIHTDAGDFITELGVGIKISIGHVDFWPNGGKHQPGCPRKSVGILSIINLGWDAACNHMRALYYFTYSINQCPYNTDGVLNGNPGCKMGFYSQSKYCKGDIHLNTTDKC